MAVAKIPGTVSPYAAPAGPRSRPLPALRSAWRALGLTPAALRTPVEAPWAIGVPMAALALIVAGALLEPAPAEEATGGAAILESVLAYALLTGFMLSVAGAMSLRRWGMGAALAVSLFSLGIVTACPVSGHHTFGAWFAGEMVLVAAAVGVATFGLLRTRP